MDHSEHISSQHTYYTHTKACFQLSHISLISRIESGELVWVVRAELGGGDGGSSLFSDGAGRASSDGGGGDGAIGDKVGLGVWELSGDGG